MLDGIVATSRSQARSLWLFREAMNEGQAKSGLNLRTDVSVPLSRLPEFVEQAEAAIAARLHDCTCVSYGHVGDGNVYLNALPPSGLSRDEAAERIYTAKSVVNDVLGGFQGSISAEHGIGRLKRLDFLLRVPTAQLHLLAAIKHAFDPSGIMTPGCQLNLTADS